MSEITDKVQKFIQNNQNNNLIEQSEAELPVVLTVDEFAQIMRINRKTAYEMATRNELPGAVRVGRKLRIATKSVIEWLHNGQSCPSKRSSGRKP